MSEPEENKSDEGAFEDEAYGNLFGEVGEEDEDYFAPDEALEEATEGEFYGEYELEKISDATQSAQKRKVSVVKGKEEIISILEADIDDDFPDYTFEEIENREEGFSEGSSKYDEISLAYSEVIESKDQMVVHKLLDRDKLIQAIHEAFIIHQKEERKNMLLNKKLVEYFRRKQSSRALHDDNADMVFEYMAKYRNLLMKLNKIKGQEEVLKKQSELKISQLKQEDQTLRGENDKIVIELNKVLREVGVTSQSSKTGLLLSEKIVDKYIRKINLLREQISTVRLELLKTQDKVTAVLLKTKQLEDLGDGLKVINFEQLRAETQSLSDKIEERNNELAKLRRRCNSDIHVLAHVREKQCMLSKTIVVHEGILRGLQNEESSCRNYLNYIKLERDELRKKLKEMSFDCGLLDKPALLRDYDRTIEHIGKVKAEVELLKLEKDRIFSELKIATMRAESKIAIKTDVQKFNEALQQEIANRNKLLFPRIKQGIKPVRNIDLSRYRSNWQK